MIHRNCSANECLCNSACKFLLYVSCNVSCRSLLLLIAHKRALFYHDTYQKVLFLEHWCVFDCVSVCVCTCVSHLSSLACGRRWVCALFPSCRAELDCLRHCRRPARSRLVTAPPSPSCPPSWGRLDHVHKHTLLKCASMHELIDTGFPLKAKFPDFH